MPLPRVRFTVRRMMVAVAVVGLLFFAGIRIGPAARLALYHASMKRDFDRAIEITFFHYPRGHEWSDWDRWLITSRDYHAEREAVHLLAVIRFWRPLPTDPPPPPSVPRPKWLR